MKKIIFIFFFMYLYAVPVNFPYTVKLKKDQTAYFNVYYLTRTYKLAFRWTLYINGILTVVYKYDKFPYQVELYKSYPLNALKIPIAKIPENYPYFYVKFKDFNGKIATFNIYLMNGRGVKADFKGKQ